MGLRRHVFFFDRNPSRTDIEEGLNKITGLKLVYEEIGQDEAGELCLLIKHPIKKKELIELDWVYEGQSMPINNKVMKNCIRVESYTGQIKNNYIEVSVVYLLKKMGGIIDSEYELKLPDWAGKKWIEVKRVYVNHLWECLKSSCFI